jgi:predicted Zn-dependent protease
MVKALGRWAIPAVALAALAGVGIWAGVRRNRPAPRVSIPDPEPELRSRALASPADPRPTLRLVAFLLESRRFHTALDEARRARTAFPEAPAVGESLAEALFETGRLDEALTELRALAATQGRYKIILASYLVRAGRTEEAAQTVSRISVFEKGDRMRAAEIYLDALRPADAARLLAANDPDSASADYRTTRGLALLAARDYGAAVKILEAVAADSPETPALQFYLGSALRLSGDLTRLEEAEGHLQQATQLQPEQALFLYELALARAQLRNWTGALEAMREAAEAGPDLPEVQRDLARLYGRLKQPLPSALAQARYLRLVDDAAGAARLLEPQWKAHPDVREVGLAYSSALYGTGKFPASGAVLETLHTRFAKDPVVLWDIFRQRRSMQHYKEASETLSELEALKPDDPTILEQRADLFERLSQYPDAERVLTHLCELEPTNAYRRYRLGYGITLWFREPEKLKTAEASLRRALQLNPEQTEAQYSMGLLLTNLNRPGEAVPYLRQALDQAPANQDALRVLARAYGQAGDRSQSDDTFALLKKIRTRSEELSRLQLPVDHLRDLRNTRLALARFQLRTGALLEATRELERLKHAFPDHTEARRLLLGLYGHSRRFQRQFEEAAAGGTGQ